MAFTIAKVAAGQNMLRYYLTSSGAITDNTTLTKARLISDCVAGALKSKLDGPYYGTDGAGQTAWAEIEQDPEISVYTPGKAPSPCVLGFQFVFNGSANVIAVEALAAGAALLEIRFNPTPIT